MIDRLEQAGYVRRVADPGDRRRVVVEPVPERAGEVGAFFDALARSTTSAIEVFTDDQLAVIVDFLDRTLQAGRAATDRLRGEAPALASSFGAPVRGVTSASLVFLSAVPNVTLVADTSLGDELYRAAFEGPVPRVRVRDGQVTVRYGAISWFDWRLRLGYPPVPPVPPGPLPKMTAEASIHWRRDRGEIRLNASVPWRIELRGGVSRISGDLRGLDLRSFELRGGASNVELTLPGPSMVVPIEVAGGVNNVSLHRPRGAAVRLRVAGGASRIVLDGERASLTTGTAETPGAEQQQGRFEIAVSGGANRVLIDEVA